MKLELSEHEKKLIFISALVAVGVGFLFYVLQQRQQPNGGAVTDVPNTIDGTAPPIYTNYNMGGQVWQLAPPFPMPDTSEDQCGCAGNCYGGPNQSNLYTGSNTYPVSGVDPNLQAYLNYLQNTNPNYVALYAAQMQVYSALFATGESYSVAGTPGQTSQLLGVTQNQ